MSEVITNHFDLWTSTLLAKTAAGRGSNGKLEAYGIKKLRDLILELAVRGKLVPQDPSDEAASELLKQTVAEKTRLIKEGVIREAKPPTFPVESPDHQLPASWVWTNLFEIGEIAPRNESDDKVEASFVSMQAISEKYGTPVQHEVKPWDEIKSGFTHFREEDVVLAKITPCFQNGKSAVMRGLTNGFGAGTTELHVYRAINACTIPEYVLIYLKSPRFIGDGIPKMTGTAGQKRITRDYFAGSHFPLPPLAEQRRIVAKVGELMALCDQLEQQQTYNLAAHHTLVETLLGTLTRVESQQEFNAAWARIASHFDTLFTTEASIDQLKQTILQLAVMGKLVPQDPNDGPAEVFYGEKMVLPKGYVRSNKQAIKGVSPISAGDLPRIPKSWVYRSVDSLYETNHILDYADGNHGSLYPRKEDFGAEGVLFLTAAQITNKGDIDWKDCPRLAHEKAKQLTKGWSKEGDVLFTHNATVGRTAIAEFCPEKEFLLGTSVTFYRLNDDSIHPNYLYLFFSSPTWYSQAEAVMQQTTRNQVSITKQALFFIALPPLPEQRRIVETVNQLFPLLERLSNGIEKSQITQIHLADAIVEQAVC